MNFTAEDQKAFESAEKCHICEQPFKEGDKRVRDHEHRNGSFNAASHNACNLNYQESFNIPVVFHNLTNYDAHFIIKQVANEIEGSIKVIPTTLEKYISIIKYVENTAVRFSFIDSFRFLNSSLDKLASYMDNGSKIILRSHFEKDSEFNLITRKGVLPYDYIKDCNVLNEKKLPPFIEFYNKLSDCNISKEDYNHAINVWNTFNCQTLGEYSDLYLKTDVLILAEVFESFRKTLHKSHKLDPAHFYTLPGYTWQCALKYTWVTLELLTDVDMIMFFERGVKGGLSQCSNRYSKANNKYMKNFDPTQETKYLSYFDINNLYGKAMCEFLPTRGFEWVEDADKLNIETIPENSDIGYVFEVDLKYPSHLHDLHKDYPFCPEQRIPESSKQSKLLATLYDKNRYIIHLKNLKQAVSHGLIITKIHRAIKFRQSPWLSKYINLNNDLRKNAKNDFEKNLYKLMNNAVFGKTMENLRKRVDVKLKTAWEGRYGAESLISQPNFYRIASFGDDLVAIQMKQLSIVYDKPIYVGMCILDISKTFMYSFHYDYILPAFKNNVKLLYSDTDSFIYEFRTNIYSFIKHNLHLFDTSDFPADNVYDIPLVNKKVLGMMKDELAGKIMTEYVGLRAKLYAYLIECLIEIKKAKGVKTNVVDKTIKFDDYLNCLRSSCKIKRKQNCIRSKLHNVYSICEEKVALSSHDDKRYLIPNSTDTLPWGHKDIEI